MLISLFALSLSAYAAAPNFQQDAIYNGQPVAASGSTWKSTVHLDFNVSKKAGGACTGVIVEEDLILTAGHCAILKGSPLDITLYKENSAASTILHLAASDYLFRADPNNPDPLHSDDHSDDLAVIVLNNQPLPDGFEPAELLTSDHASAMDPGQIATVVGSGLTEKGKLSNRLYFKQGEIGDYEEGDLMQIQFPDNSGACEGDSGGPVFVSSDKQLYLIALNTAITPDLNKQCGTTLDANVITASRYEWIEKTATALRAQLK